jgi:hypothetical protein
MKEWRASEQRAEAKRQATSVEQANNSMQARSMQANNHPMVQATKDQSKKIMGASSGAGKHSMSKAAKLAKGD